MIRNRLKPELLARAARYIGKMGAEFLLEVGPRAAQDALLDRTLFDISRQDHARFVERLDAPPRPNERLRRMMTTKAPWE
ncbi:DUF1778 domain-containing protein [Methylocystis sp. SC2]|uniref:type II toxin-antitoxin system TacA family antitoxin n=1 Tax=Methylocystis sp. (strain SC2) TaxID=187303 RepID=UPI00027AF12E|nr:DUF1778 domain-containing protein [Methylocystis sp. SC2]CCJ07724.1 Conserved hypothetical protein [Methylocystis sp. SC2]